MSNLISFFKGGIHNNKRDFVIKEIRKHVNCVPGGKVDISWEYLGNPTDIVATAPGCGCTSSIQYKGNNIIATYTDVSDVTTNGNNITAEQIKLGYIELQKDLRVFFDDGLPLKVMNGTSKIFNQNKAHIKIYFIVRIDLTSFRGKK